MSPLPYSRDDLPTLTDLFRRVGAPKPESFAESEHAEGIPQFAMYIMLRTFWDRCVSSKDDSWLESRISDTRKSPSSPFQTLGHVIPKMIAAGIPREDIVDMVREIQVETMAQMLYTLDDSSVTHDLELDHIPEVGDIHWGVYLELCDDLGHGAPSPMSEFRMGGLDACIFYGDPENRELRPRWLDREKA